MNCYLRRQKKDSFVKSEDVLSIIGQGEKQYESYKKLIRDSCRLAYNNIREDRLAVKNFNYKLMDLFAKKKKGYFGGVKSNGLLDLEGMIRKVCGKRRRRSFSDRKAFLYCVEQLRARGYTVTEIASRLEVERSTIYRIQVG